MCLVVKTEYCIHESKFNSCQRLRYLKYTDYDFYFPVKKRLYRAIVMFSSLKTETISLEI